MTFFLIQLAFDGALIGVFLVWYAGHKSQLARASSATSPEEMESIREKFRHLESEMLRYKERVEVQLIHLKKICDDATRILLKASATDLSLEGSFEESELKSAMLTPEQIPTLSQMEKARGRLDNEMRVDLRSLLRDQLV